MSDASGFDFHPEHISRIGCAITSSVPGAVVDREESTFSPGWPALRISHKRLAWSFEIVSLYGEFLVMFSPTRVYFSQDRPYRKKLDDSVDWAVNTAIRALRSGLFIATRHGKPEQLFFGDETEELRRVARSADTLTNWLPPIES